MRRRGSVARLAPWQEMLAKEMMSERLASQVALDEVAERCRLSLCHFVRAFRNSVGVAPYHWFLSERIARSKILLAASPMPLAQIALECGFGDQSHFTNTFVRHVGETPGRWRRAAARDISQ